RAHRGPRSRGRPATNCVGGGGGRVSGRRTSSRALRYPPGDPPRLWGLVVASGMAPEEGHQLVAGGGAGVDGDGWGDADLRSELVGDRSAGEGQGGFGQLVVDRDVLADGTGEVPSVCGDVDQVEVGGEEAGDLSDR